MNFLSYIVVEISLTIKCGEEEKRHIQERSNWIMPLLNPTIQPVVVYLYTKYEHFILNGSRDIFDENLQY